MLFGAKKAVPSATAVMGAAADGRASIPTITHAAQPVAAAPASLTAVTARKPGRTRTLSKDDLSKLAAEQRHRRQRDFGRIVALLASVPEYQDLPLKDLHWLVMPAVTAGQYLMAEVKSEAGKPSGLAAVLLWARLSPEVEARVAEAKAKPIRLQPAEWTSGPTPRVIATAGRKDAVAGLMLELRNKVVT